jgi:voltage-gated potassium channel
LPFGACCTSPPTAPPARRTLEPDLSADPPPSTLPFSDSASRFGRPASGWRLKLYAIIFESDTRAGVLFDKVLLVAIVASVAVVMVDSVSAYSGREAPGLRVLEWMFTLLFTVEYVARLACVQRPWRYARNFFGIVDLVSVLPTYLAILFPALHALIDVRVLRLLRVFRILKLTEYVAEYQVLGTALRNSSRKIAVFISAVLMIVVATGTVMYVVEGPANGFTSIPVSVYWAITTMTTVGFGDIAPKTDLGRFIASLIMLMGWGVLAVPTGIVTAEMTSQRLRGTVVRLCRACGAGGHMAEARFCHGCGTSLGR